MGNNSDLIHRGRLLHTVLDQFGVDLAYLGRDLQFCQEAIESAPAEKAIPVSVVKGYLLGLIDEWSKLGDRRYDQPNIQVYNHIRKELDDLEAYCAKHAAFGVCENTKEENTMQCNCDDNRLEIIQKAKEDLVRSTNIETSPDEMAVLDNVLFRAWQMGWLEQYEPDYKVRMKQEYWQLKDRYEKLHRMCTKYEAGTLDFTPNCPLELLKEQKAAMGCYLHCLEVRAEIEGVNL